MKNRNIKTVKELKALGPAPAGHTYGGSSMAYWRKHKNAFTCYDACKWTGRDGKKQTVVVEIVPDVDSLTFHQGSTCSWDLDEHDSTNCEHCGVIFAVHTAED